MKSTFNKVVTLSEDIIQIAKNEMGESFDLIRFCRDHPDPLLFYDNKPVLDITQDEFLMIFDPNSNHYFLSPYQALRIGEYCKLALPNMIGLMLKAEWERFALLIIGFSTGTEIYSGSGLKDTDFVENRISGFRPCTDNFFDLIRENVRSSTDKITYGYIDLLINDLLNQNIFLCENEQIGKLYKKPKTDNQQNYFVSTLNETQRTEYLHKKELWNLKSAELDEFLLFLERKKRFNINTEDKYFRAFRKLEIERSRLIYRIDKYEIILSIMLDKPELSYRELLTLAEAQLLKAETKRNDCKNKINRCQNYIDGTFNDNNQSYITSDFKNKYSRECKKLLRKLFFMLHPDTASGNLSLTDCKKHQLNSLWLKLMKTTNEINSFSPTMLLYHLPDYEQLESIYIKACEILDINPENYEVGNRLEFMIGKGTPFNEIMEFLKNEIEKLELQLANLELAQNEYTNEKQTQIYRYALENINDHTKKLKNEIKNMESQIKALKLKIINELKKVPNEQR